MRQEMTVEAGGGRIVQGLGDHGKESGDNNTGAVTVYHEPRQLAKCLTCVVSFNTHD